MQIETSTLMMVFFIISLIISIWKIYAFLPNKQLKDDDTTKEAQEKLECIMVESIKEMGAEVSEKELFEKMQLHKEFDKEKFWRFNPNKLKHLLNTYYLKHPEVKSIRDIKDL